MAKVTEKYNLPYPELTDEANVPQDIQKLVEKLEELLDVLYTRTQHITADENGTHFVEGVFANGYEITSDDECLDPSTATATVDLESEE